MKPIEIIHEQIKGFISSNKEHAIPFLTALSARGSVELSDLRCDENRLQELNESAKKFGLMNEENKASDLMRNDLRNYLFQKNKSERDDDEVTNTKKDDLIYKTHEKIFDFLEKNKDRGAADYLAILAIKGEVKTSDLKSVLGIISFTKLNHNANSVGLINPGYLPNNKVTVPEETKEALRKFFIEGSLVGRSSDVSQAYLREVYEKNLKNIGYSPEMEKKGWTAIFNTTDEVAIIKHYLQKRTEKGLKEFPGITVKVYYGQPTKGEDWKDPSFFVSVSGNPKEANGEPDLEYLAKVKKVANELKEIFPESNKSEVRVRMDKESNGIYVYGSPIELAVRIKEKDKAGWNNSVLREGGMWLG